MCLYILIPVIVIIQLFGIQVFGQKRIAGGDYSVSVIGLDCEQITLLLLCLYRAFLLI